MITDEETDLIEGCIRGEEEAWRKMVERYTPVLTRAVDRCRRNAGLPEDPALAEEISLEVLEALSADGGRMLRGFRRESSLSTWLSGIARRKYRMHLRREGRERRKRRELLRHKRSTAQEKGDLPISGPPSWPAAVWEPSIRRNDDSSWRCISRGKATRCWSASPVCRRGRFLPGCPAPSNGCVWSLLACQFDSIFLSKKIHFFA